MSGRLGKAGSTWSVEMCTSAASTPVRCRWLSSADRSAVGTLMALRRSAAQRQRTHHAFRQAGHGCPTEAVAGQLLG